MDDENKQQEASQDPFDQFDVPEVQDGPIHIDLEQAEQQMPGGLESVIQSALILVTEVLQGDFRNVLDMNPVDRQTMLSVLTGSKPNNPVFVKKQATGDLGDPFPEEQVGPTGPTPSQKKVENLVRTPEEIAREKDFLDQLGI